jgi:hypothetical protein
MRVAPTIDIVLDLLRADPAFDGVLVRHGLLTELPLQRERVYVLGVSGYERRPTTSGHRVRTESFGLRGLVEVHKLGTQGPDDVMARAWELLEAIDEVLMRDPDLGPAEYTGELGVAADEVVVMTDGWLCRAVFRLSLETYR